MTTPITATATAAAQPSDSALNSAMRKAAWRLVPLLAIAYVVNFLDRTNVGFAGLTMNNDLGLTPAMFGLGSSVLFVGYVLFEVPSNLALYRYGARRWLARIMISWGAASAATALAQGPTSFNIIRFLVGAAEAGFFPGVAFFLALWFPPVYRTRVLGWFTVAIPVSSLIGGPLSGVLLNLHGLLGLAGWQWLFLVEGLPAVFVGFLLLALLSDRPQDAKWLTPEERAALAAALDSERHEAPKRTFGEAVRDPRVLLLSVIIFGFTAGNTGLGIWLPQILKSHGLTNTQVAWTSAIPYLFAMIGMLLWARSVDRSGRRVTNLVLACFLAGAGFAASVLLPELLTALVGVTVALIGINSARVIFWTIPPRFLTGLAAAGGFAFINSVGNIGGIAGPSLIGWLRESTGSFQIGLVVMAGLLAFVGVLATLFHTPWLRGATAQPETR